MFCSLLFFQMHFYLFSLQIIAWSFSLRLFFFAFLVGGKKMLIRDHSAVTLAFGSMHRWRLNIDAAPLLRSSGPFFFFLAMLSWCQQCVYVWLSHWAWQDTWHSGFCLLLYYWRLQKNLSRLSSAASVQQRLRFLNLILMSQTPKRRQTLGRPNIRYDFVLSASALVRFITKTFIFKGQERSQGEI